MKKRFLLILLIIPILLLIGCSKGAEDSGEYKDNIGTYYSLVSESKNNVVYETTQKIMYSVEYSMYIDNMEEVIESIGSENTLLGGYLGNSTQEKNCATIIYRIPTDKLNEFLDFIDSKDGISKKSVSTSDVTTKYSETEARISVLNASREAYLKMMEDEKLTLSELVLLQDKIDEIDTELLSYSNELAYLNNKLSYSTVTISYYRNSDYNEPSWFTEYFESLGEFFVGIGKFILYLIPIGGTFALIGFGIYLVVKKIVKNKKTKKEQNKF